jgi:uncharacterized protein (TIRG00374 family)
VAGIEALEQIARSDFRYLAVTVAAVGSITAISSYRWGLVANTLAGQELASWGQYYHFNILARVTSLFVPRMAGDFGTRTLALTATKKTSVGLAFSSTILDRMFDILDLAVLTLPCLLTITKVISLEMGGLMTLVFILTISGLIATRWAVLWRFLLSVMSSVAALGSRLPLVKGAITPERVGRLRELADHPIDSKLALRIYLLTVARTLLMVLRSYSVVLALGLSVPFLAIYLVVPAAQLFLLIAITPMGLGLRELGWAGFLALMGMSREDALTFSLGHRAYLYVTVAILGLLSYLSVALQRRRSGRPQLAPAPNPDDGTEQ